MSAHSLTCSGLGLALHCSWSFRPDAEHALDEPGRWAVNNAIHAVFDRTIDTGAEDCAIPRDLIEHLTDGDVRKVHAAHTAWLADWYLDQRDGGWRSEVAFAFDPETGASMRLQPKHHRDYSGAPPGWIPGTADVIRWNDELEVDAIDHKSGHFAPAAEDNAQLAGIALAAGARSFRGAIGHATEDSYTLRWMTLDRFELLDWLDRIAAVVRRLPTAEAVPGPWCRDRFCRSFGLCPATEGSLERAAPEAKRMLPVVSVPSAIEGPEHAAELLRVMREAKAGFEARYNIVREALRQWADANGGIPTDNGKRWIRREVTRETIDLSSADAVRVLGEQLGEEAFNLAVTTTTETSKVAIRRAARVIKEKVGEPVASVERRAIEALRGVGAIRSSTSMTYSEAKFLAEGSGPA